MLYGTNDMSGFQFQKNGSGCYKVTYTTPKRGDYWVANINDMWLIDITLHAECARRADVRHLREIVKRKGEHFSWDGRKLK